MQNQIIADENNQLELEIQSKQKNDAHAEKFAREELNLIFEDEDFLRFKETKSNEPKDNIAVIIPAAGSGSRFGGSTPKQFLNIGDETVLEKSVNLFLEISNVKEIIVAINSDEDLIKSQSFYENPIAKVVSGGSSRE